MPNNAKVDHLCFVRSPIVQTSFFSASQRGPPPTVLRLFSTSGGSTVTEHYLSPDLAFDGAESGEDALGQAVRDAIQARAKVGTTRTLSSDGGTVWSLAVSPTGRFLALGCEDGEVRLFDISTSDTFEPLTSSSRYFSRSRPVQAATGPTTEYIGATSRLEKAAGRVMALAWGPPRRLGPSPRAAARRTAAPRPGDESEGTVGTDSDSDSDSDSDADDDLAESGSWEDTFLVGGTAAGQAVVWNPSTGRIGSKLSVRNNRRERTIVWSAAVLADGTIILGDSNGRVTFYDPVTRLALPAASFRAHGPEADVLALIVGPDGRRVYSAGVDQRVVEYSLVGALTTASMGAQRALGPNLSSGGARWMTTAVRRLHAHDIRALAIEPNFDITTAAQAVQDRLAKKPGQDGGSRVPLLASGGTDCMVTFTPAATVSGGGKFAAPKGKAKGKPASDNFADAFYRKAPYVPGSTRASLVGGGSVALVCPGKRWIVLRHEKEVRDDAGFRREHTIAIWSLPSRAVLRDESLGAAPIASVISGEDGQWKKIIEMQFQARTPLISHAISPDGQLLALSDLYETKLFRLHPRAEDKVAPQRLATLRKAFDDSVPPGASALSFTPDGQRLVLASYASATVHVIDLAASTLAASFTVHRARFASTPFGRSIAPVRRKKDEAVDENMEVDRAGSPDAAAAAGSEAEVYAVVHHAAISPDGQWLLTVDSLRRVHVFNLDSMAHVRQLASPSQVPTAVDFHPSLDPASEAFGVALMVLPTNAVEFVTVEGHKPAAWLTRLSHQAVHLIRRQRNPATGVAWLPQRSGQKRALMLWGATWLGVVSAPASMAGERPGADAHSRIWDDIQGALCVAALPPRPEDTAAEPEVVVVERPFIDIVGQFPPAYYRGVQYGT